MSCFLYEKPDSYSSISARKFLSYVLYDSISTPDKESVWSVFLSVQFTYCETIYKVTLIDFYYLSSSDSAEQLSTYILN